MAEIPLCEMEADGTKKNYCPFGCTKEALDEYGYCRHLIGFSADGKTFEPIRQLVRNDFKTGKAVETGYPQVIGVQTRGQVLPAVKPEDHLVMKTEVQDVDGLRRVANKWNSYRVYRENAHTSRFAPGKVEELKVDEIVGEPTIVGAA